mmetsp:Transcript_162086/g.295971  ORF Transcript_162086/g.295971 Transcript_162086/m.295971 type:complete len:80 (-) Transcript_162086:259-498(-)
MLVLLSYLYGLLNKDCVDYIDDCKACQTAISKEQEGVLFSYIIKQDTTGRAKIGKMHFEHRYHCPGEGTIVFKDLLPGG